MHENEKEKVLQKTSRDVYMLSLKKMCCMSEKYYAEFRYIISYKLGIRLDKKDTKNFINEHVMK